jgi:hypothetical protein
VKDLMGTALRLLLLAIFCRGLAYAQPIELAEDYKIEQGVRLAKDACRKKGIESIAFIYDRSSLVGLGLRKAAPIYFTNDIYFTKPEAIALSTELMSGDSNVVSGCKYQIGFMLRTLVEGRPVTSIPPNARRSGTISFTGGEYRGALSNEVPNGHSLSPGMTDPERKVTLWMAS